MVASNPETVAARSQATPAYASTTADARPVGAEEAVTPSGGQDPLERSAAFDQLDALLQQRIVLIDGAMGTAIQRYKLTEEDYQGQHYQGHTHELKGNNDILVVSKPDVIEAIHMAYLEAGADILESKSPP